METHRRDVSLYPENVYFPLIQTSVSLSLSLLHISHADVSVSAEALNQGENVDLDALMADLCSIEQELSTVNAKPNSAGSMARLGLTDTKVHTCLWSPSG